MFGCFGGYGGYGGYGGGFLSSIMGLLMVILFVVIIVYIVKRLRGDSFNQRENNKIDTTQEALSLLNVKFASGEISEEEYEKKKNLILKR